MSQYLTTTKTLKIKTPPRPELLENKRMEALRKEIEDLKNKLKEILQEQVSLRSGLNQVMDYLEDGSEEDHTDTIDISDEDE